MRESFLITLFIFELSSTYSTGLLYFTSLSTWTYVFLSTLSWYRCDLTPFLEGALLPSFSIVNCITWSTFIIINIFHGRLWWNLSNRLFIVTVYVKSGRKGTYNVSWWIFGLGLHPDELCMYPKSFKYCILASYHNNITIILIEMW